MTKKTRYFLAGSAAVLVAGLGVGLAAYFGGGFPSLSASRSGPAELAYVPADATVVAYADVRQIMDSELRQRLKQAMPAQETQGQKEFEQQTGIDIEKDIQQVIAAVTTADASRPEGLVVARGNFNPTQLETLAREHGGVVEDYKGKRLITVADHPREGADTTAPVRQHPVMALAFLEPGLVAIGSEAAIKSSIEAQLSARSITSNDEMMELVSSIDRDGFNNAWAVGRFDTLASKANLPEEVRNRLPAIKTFAVTTHIDGGLAGTVRAEARDDQSAENLRQVVQGFLALGRMQGQNDPKVAAMLQSLQLSGSGKTVALSFTVPSEIFQMLPHRGDESNEPHGTAPRPPAAPKAPAPPTPDK